MRPEIHSTFRLGLGRTLKIAPLLGILWALAPSTAALAWTPQMQAVIAREGARLAPRDLARQIRRREVPYLAGVQAPFGENRPEQHYENPDGSGKLDEAIHAEAQAAITAIQKHRPFDEIVGRLGRLAHFVADANNPLATDAADRAEGRYFLDFLDYAESAEPRLPLVFYGIPKAFGDLNGGRGRNERPDFPRFVGDMLSKGRELYPSLGQEYRRIGFGAGRAKFDDRSTAFAVASLSFSRAVGNVGMAFRAVWLAAGGIDARKNLAPEGQRVSVVPRGR